MATTSIEWTDRTWNPVTGCSKVSPGCAHCYAETIAKRLWPTSYPPVLRAVDWNGVLDGTVAKPRECYSPRKFTDVRTHEDRLLEPLKWRKPARVFVNSMSDLFHEDVPDEFIDQVFAVMALAGRHTFQILTKRAGRMRDYITRQNAHGFSRESNINGAIWSTLGTPRGSKIHHGGNWRCTWPLPNVWLGVSVENQHFADERIPLLLQTPAAVRFISAEPLLRPVNMYAFLAGKERDECLRILGHGAAAAPGLDWVIVGGESGPGARPFDLAWARSIVQQCQAAGVPVFVKQLGKCPSSSTPEPGWQPLYDYNDIHFQTPTAWAPNSGGSGKHGDPADWPADLRVREFPRASVSEVRA